MTQMLCFSNKHRIDATVRNGEMFHVTSKLFISQHFEILIGWLEVV
jgi:hypothetical protein